MTTISANTSGEQEQVFELIDDLTDKSSRDYDPSHERQTIESYCHYFLGSIIISNKDGRKFLIDGQERLTTLILLLILNRPCIIETRFLESRLFS